MNKCLSLIAIYLFCFSQAFLSAQSWQDLYDRSNDCWGKDWHACKDILTMALEAAEKEFGQSDSNYIQTLYSLGMCHSSLGDLPQAFAIFQEAVSLTQTHLGKENPEYARGLTDLGNVSFAQGRFEEAIAFYQSSKYWTEQSLGRDHPEYNSRLTNLGVAYQAIGDYEKGLVFLTEALAHTAQTQGKNSLDYGLVLNHLGRMYHNMGKYEMSLRRYQESLNTTAEVVGKQHPVYGIRLNNIGLLHEAMGNYEEAEQAFEASLVLIEQTLGRQHPEYATRCNNLGNIYGKLGRKAEAIQKYEESLEIVKRIHGNTHPQYGMYLNNLGNIYLKVNQTQKGLSYLEEAVQVMKGSLGTSHPMYGKILGNLAGAYQDNHNYDQATIAINEALDILANSLGNAHPDYGTFLLQVARLSQLTGKREKAITQFLELSTHTSSYVHTQLSTLTDRLQVSMLRELQIRWDMLSSARLAYPQSSELQMAGYNQQLLLKGLIQNNQVDLFNHLRTDSDSSVQTQFEEWQSLHRFLANQYRLPIHRRISSFDSLRIVVDQLELQIAQQSQRFREAQQKLTWQDIQKTLQPEEIAIEFSHFPLYEEGKKTDQVVYVAFLLRADSPPKLITLFEEEELNKQLESAGQQTAQHKLYAIRGIRPKKGEVSLPRLSELIWQPLDTLLTGIRRIYYAPSGLLHRVNLEAIPINKTKLLSDSYEMVRLGSTKALVYKEEEKSLTKERRALLLGGIQYDRDSSFVMRSAANPSPIEQGLSELNDFPFTHRGGLDSWSYLDGSALEVKSIASLLREKDYEVALLMGRDATEEEIQAPRLASQIIHIATHGYFFPDPGQSEDTTHSPYTLSDHPMIRSGLILTGANHAWEGNPVPEGQEDGILTAYEISRMDLSNTELVVLSACETGLGEIQGNEGVYGLQRAFKIAGAKYVMMSLWQVPDKATQELMTAFYENWLGGMEIRSALQAAQKQMRKKYKEPYYWAGFVLVE